MRKHSIYIRRILNQCCYYLTRRYVKKQNKYLKVTYTVRINTETFEKQYEQGFQEKGSRLPGSTKKAP
jgi:hypothetical protein